MGREWGSGKARRSGIGIEGEAELDDKDDTAGEREQFLYLDLGNPHHKTFRETLRRRGLIGTGRRWLSPVYPDHLTLQTTSALKTPFTTPMST